MIYDQDLRNIKTLVKTSVSFTIIILNEVKLLVLPFRITLFGGKSVTTYSCDLLYSKYDTKYSLCKRAVF